MPPNKALQATPKIGAPELCRWAVTFGGKDMNEIPLVKMFLTVFALATTVACAAMIPPTTKYPSKAAVDYVLHQRQGSVTVGVEPLTTQEQVIEWFGSDLTKNGLVAVHLVIEIARGSSDGMILLTEKVVLGDAAQKTGAAAQIKLPGRGVSSEEVTRQFVVGIFAGGAPWEATAVHLRDQVSLQNRMRELALRDDTLRPGESAHGFVYFRVEKPWDSSSRMVLALTLKNIRTSERVPLNIELPRNRLPFLASPN